MIAKALVAPFALLAGLALGTGAFAQTEVGTIVVSDMELPYVQQYCEDLADAGLGSDPEEREPSPLEEVRTPGVVLGSLHISDCKEAGLIEG
ncbi:hypothetical protein [Pelagibacterium halotolerans]|uniref:hypothetical protein n=1 Tax=Pelagibacterium halotolerans TaxID=531813 RepID=UPI00384E2C22